MNLTMAQRNRAIRGMRDLTHSEMEHILFGVIGEEVLVEKMVDVLKHQHQGDFVYPVGTVKDTGLRCWECFGIADKLGLLHPSEDEGGEPGLAIGVLVPTEGGQR